MRLLAAALFVGCTATPVDFLSKDDSTRQAEAMCEKTYNCKGGCGRCFNVGARTGVVCAGQGGQTGYYCPPESEGMDAAFACMDWTFGSSAMRAAEANFTLETKEDVYFGIGTYGNQEDKQRGLGACWRLRVEGVDKDIIAQSINTGHDVAGNQFDLQIGAGGAGAFNTCAGGDGSMYPGARDAWGCVYGGVDSREECAALPVHPRQSAAMKTAGDSLVALCEYGWDKGVRLSGAGKSAGRCKYNPTLLDVSRVRCPEQLVEFTQMQRKDEPEGYAAAEGHRPAGFPNFDRTNTCKAQEPGAGVDFCLTRMMDCRKPSGAFKDNVRPELMVRGKKVVQTCTSDGYTRYDVTCGCQACYC